MKTYKNFLEFVKREVSLSLRADFMNLWEERETIVECIQQLLIVGARLILLVLFPLKWTLALTDGWFRYRNYEINQHKLREKTKDKIRSRHLSNTNKVVDFSDINEKLETMSQAADEWQTEINIKDTNG
jgi:hypothetical protein